jgi:DNA-binding NtrC family response regulator
LPKGGEKRVQRAAKEVLLIDDDVNITRSFARILQRRGYQVDIAETGKEAIEKTQNKPYQVALTEVCLPDINGVDLLDKLCDHGCRMIKIFITSHPTMLEEKKASSADAYLLKPVRPEELIALLNRKTQELGVDP